MDRAVRVRLWQRESVETIRTMVAWRKANASPKEYERGLAELRYRETEAASIVSRNPSSNDTSSFQPRARKADESTA
jgi:hypothetical protein